MTLEIAQFRTSNFEFRNRRFFPLLLVAIALSACVTTRPRSQAAGDRAFVIEGVPERVWGDNSCGAGALATVLNRFDDPVTEAELDATFAKGRNRGVVSLDLLLEAKRRGYAASLRRGDEASVAAAVTNGHPVILMLKVADLPGEARDLFHYIVVDGIDPDRGLMRMQFGDGKLRWAPLGSIDRAWSGGGYAALFIEGQSGNAPHVQTALRRAVALEESGRVADALAIYRQLLAGAPQPALLWTNIGNAERKRGDLLEAEKAYRAAISAEPSWRDALNNLAWMLYEGSRDLDEAEALATRALASPGPDDWNVLETLGRIQIARGRCAEGVATLTRAADAATDANARDATRNAAEDAREQCGADS